MSEPFFIAFFVAFAVGCFGWAGYLLLEDAACERRERDATRDIYGPERRARLRQMQPQAPGLASARKRVR